MSYIEQEKDPSFDNGDSPDMDVNEIMKMDEAKKSIKAKPHFYSVCLQGLQQIAKEYGYNLLIHGSMNRDMDLVCVAWVDEPKTHHELLNAFCEYLGVMQWNEIAYFHPKILDGGRSAYIINLNRGGKFNGYLDAQYYLDISFTPDYKEIPIKFSRWCMKYAKARDIGNGLCYEYEGKEYNTDELFEIFYAELKKSDYICADEKQL